MWFKLLALIITFPLTCLLTWYSLRWSLHWVVQRVGPRYFADPKSLNLPFWTFIGGGVTTASMALLLLFQQPWLNAYKLLIFMIPFFLFNNITELIRLGKVIRIREFKIDNNQLFSCKNKKLIQPSWIQTYVQTHDLPPSDQTPGDSGKTYFEIAFFITVHTKENLFSNGYTTEQEWTQVREILLPLAPQLDLVFVCQVEPTIWQTATMDQTWMPLLMGQENALPESSRQYWNQLLRPRLGRDEQRLLSKTELGEQLAELRKAFSEACSPETQLGANLAELEAFAVACCDEPLAMADSGFWDVVCRGVPDVELRVISYKDEVCYRSLKTDSVSTMKHPSKTTRTKRLPE